MAQAAHPESTREIAPDDNFDGDSALSVPVSDVTSLRSSVRRFQEENGRTYHSMSAGKYQFPNDDQENERLDLQHNLWLLTMKGRLGLCPLIQEGGAKRVLDCGTGTGVWAIEYADMFPEAEVIGVDLSPIQPSLVPPNCLFEVDDLEKEWTWTTKFDLIFGRIIVGIFEDYQKFFDRCFAHLDPGGYLEIQDMVLPYCCDDGTLSKDSYLYRLSTVMMEASAKGGRRMDQTIHYEEMMRKAGFVDIQVVKYKWPFNTWPKDPFYKELGAWTLVNVDAGIEGFIMALVTRVLGWSKEEALVFCSKARKEAKDTKIHAYLSVWVFYGRKPEA